MGADFHTSGKDAETEMNKGLKKYTEPLDKLASLPLKKEYKERAIMGILAPRWWFCPWSGHLKAWPYI